MDEIQQRANQVDKKLKDVTTTLNQLKHSLPDIVKSNAALNPAFDTKSKTNDPPVLSRSETLKVLSGLKSIREKVFKYEEERKREKQHLAQVRDAMKKELIAIKKEIMIDNLRQTPDDFRKYLQSQLESLKEEIIKINSSNNTNNMNMNMNISDSNKSILNKVKSELIGIRKEMADKIEELNQYKEWEKEMEAYKANLKTKLFKVRNDIEQYEKELIQTKRELNRLQNENEDYRKGNRIPALLQDTITSKLSILKEQVFQVETENKTFRMQLDGTDPLLSISKSLYITSVDMHTGGEPLRIIENGIPSLSGVTLLEKQQSMILNYDYYRKFLMHEPRGHFDMYGVIITQPDNKQLADFAVLFMHNEGYSSMCGHAIIALGRYAIDFGLIKLDQNDNDKEEKKKEKEEGDEEETEIGIVRIQCPCGIVRVNVEIDRKTQRSTGNVSFISAPGWSEYISTSIQLDQFGKIEIDIGYGGAYYAICPATRFNLNVRDSPIDDLINISTLIKQTVIKKLQLSHPDSKDLQFLYGVILTDGHNEISESSANVCVFADRQVDRSPTGSGVIARLAIDFSKKNIKIKQKRKFIGKTGSIFHGEIVKVLNDYKGKKNAVIVKVTGSAKYCGRSQFYLENGDELGRGFLMK